MTGLNCNYRAWLARLPLKFSFSHLYVLGDRAGQHEILTDSLPGLPDNIKARNKCYKLFFTFFSVTIYLTNKRRQCVHNWSINLGQSSVSNPDQYRSALIWPFWIRIRIGNANFYPGARIINNYTWFTVVQMGFSPTWACFITYYLHIIFMSKSIFFDASAWFRHGFGSLDPDPHRGIKLVPDPNWN